MEKRKYYRNLDIDQMKMAKKCVRLLDRALGSGYCYFNCFGQM